MDKGIGTDRLTGAIRALERFRGGEALLSSAGWRSAPGEHSGSVVRILSVYAAATQRIGHPRVKVLRPIHVAIISPRLFRQRREFGDLRKA